MLMQDVGIKISIITATFNSKRYIADTIRSILTQRYKNIQYIVVDGASSDGTLEVLQHFRSRIDVLISEKDAGVYDAFNKGIRVATGDVLYFLNSDDYLVDDTVLESIAKSFLDHPSILGVYGKIIYRQEDMDLWEPFPLQYLGAKELRMGMLPPHPAFFAKRELYKKIGFFDLNYKIAADTDYMQRCFRDYPDGFFFIDRWISVHRRGGVSTNLKGYDLVRQEHAAVLEKHRAIKIPYPSYEAKMNAYYRRWLENLLFKQRGASPYLLKLGVKKIAIIGANRMGLYLFRDAQLSDIETIAFLDNNPPMIGQKMQNIIVFPLSWLREHGRLVDAVLIAIDGVMDHPGFQPIITFIKRSGISVFSWRELLEMSEDM